MATQRISRYELGGRLASGGMAEIFAARAVAEQGVAKRVVLKKVLPSLGADKAFVSRFLDEARVAVRLSHANIVQVFDFGSAGDDYFIAMEYVEGVDLKRLLQEVDGPLTLGESLYIAVQVLRGLDYAHRRADDDDQPLLLVHRDVKPANVLLSFEGEVKLTDFGIARSRAGSQLSAAGSICGTIAFMSPEQAYGRGVDLRSDVFAVGTMLYNMVTGQHPFETGNDLATLERVREGKVAAPSTLGMPEELDPIILQALAYAPEDRYPSAGAFADALEEFAFAHGVRLGAATIARRLTETFPAERERLGSLFAAQREAEALAVSTARGPRGYTRLSRVAMLRTEPSAVAAAQSQGTRPVTQAPGAPRRVPLAIGAAALVVLAVAGALVWRLRAGGGDAGPARDAGAAFSRADSASAGGAASRPDASPAGGAADGGGPAGGAADGGGGSASGADTSAAAGPVDGGRGPAAGPVDGGRGPAVKPSPPAGEGTLTVNADPWGNVIVNGRLIRATPLLAHPLRAGPATVIVENPKLGRRVFQVRIRPNQDTRLIVDLRAPAGTR